MFIVAITRWGPGFDRQLPELAKRLGLFPYDLRLRLNGPLPVIVARVGERGEASTLMAQLREWGHGAVGCDASTVPAAEAMDQPREFAFDLNDGSAVLRTEQAEVAADQVYALIHALVLTDHQQTQTKTSKKFSATRAVLSGGLVMTSKSSSTERATDSESEERIYLVRRGFTQPMLFRQHQLRYTGLGAALGPSSHDNFATLSERLQRFCPGAYYSNQLRETRRKGSFAGATTAKAGATTTQTVSSSNASDVDLAAHLIVVAHARGQL